MLHGHHAPWSTEDELVLLSAVLELGFGNWKDVSIRVGRPPHDCENHCVKAFLENPDIIQLKSVKDEYFGKVRSSNQLCTNACQLKVATMSTDCANSWSRTLEAEELLRGLDSSEDTEDKLQKAKRCYNIGGSQTVTHYCAERSEFGVEYDDRAEGVLAALCPSPSQREQLGTVGDGEMDEEGCDNRDLLENMELALVNAYNLRLEGRRRARRIVRDHALVYRRKSYLLFQRYENALGRQNVITLIRFAQFASTGAELDVLLERLCLQRELRCRINILLNYRWAGLRSMASTSLYSQLNDRRTAHKRYLEASYVPLTVDWVGCRASKRPSAPLSLFNLPGYSLLDDEEKELCSVARIVPETYYGFKNLLVQECKKNNGLKLAQARQLIKIDVNKTRKMYNHLLSKRLIWQPA